MLVHTSLRKPTSFSLRKTVRPFLWLLIVLTFVSSGPLAALAQQYESLPYKKLASSRSRVQRMLRGDETLAGNEETFDAFFTQYVFAEMAPSDPQKLGNIGYARVKFRNQYLKASTFRNPAARDRLNQLAMVTMKQVINGNFPPGVRTNAVLTIAMLNQEPPVVSGANRQPPVPWPEASEYLLSLLDASRQDALLISALVGLVRHAKYGLNDQQRAELTPKMLAIVSQRESPSGRLPEVHVWFRTGAADVLAAMRDPGSGNEVLGALQTLFIEKGASNEQRCWAAAALAQLRYDETPKEIASTLVGQLGDFAVFSCQEENEIGSQNMLSGGPLRRGRTARGGSGLGMEMDMMGMFGGGPGRGQGVTDRRGRPGGRPGQRDRDTPRTEPKVEVETVFPRRELADRLDCAGDALQVVRIAADDTHKDLAEQLLKQIKTARKALDDQYKEDADLVLELDRVCQAMESALRKARATAEETPDTAAPDETDQADEDDVLASE